MSVGEKLLAGIGILAGMGQTACNQPTTDGGQCRNGPGCTVDHKGQMTAFLAGHGTTAAVVAPGPGADPFSAENGFCCGGCGSEEVPAGEVFRKRDAEFCSEECWESITEPCEGCGDLVEYERRYSNDNGAFCSYECAEQDHLANLEANA